jgi:hypothetical protein
MRCRWTAVGPAELHCSPFETTLGAGNPRPEDFPASAGIEARMTNWLRALECSARIPRSPTQSCAPSFDVTVSSDRILSPIWSARSQRSTRPGATRRRDERPRAAQLTAAPIPAAHDLALTPTRCPGAQRRAP